MKINNKLKTKTNIDPWYEHVCWDNVFSHMLSREVAFCGSTKFLLVEPHLKPR